MQDAFRDLLCQGDLPTEYIAFPFTLLFIYILYIESQQLRHFFLNNICKMLCY